MNEVPYAVPFDYDAWKLASPEEPEGGRVCGDCLFCKEVGRTLACVVETYDAEDEGELHDADLCEVTLEQEACDRWVDAEEWKWDEW